MNDAKGLDLVDELKKEEGNQQRQQNIVYKHVDVSDYDSILSLFRFTVDLHGKVDIAIHCAGITEIPGWFDPTITLDTISKVRGQAAVQKVLLIYANLFDLNSSRHRPRYSTSTYTVPFTSLR